MKRVFAVLVAMLGLLVSAGYAAAESPGDARDQAAGQAAGSGQAAAALSGASQTKPTNTNISVRVLSPGDDGHVTQSNSVSSNATAANANVTDQSADQKQGGSGGTQAVGQESKNDQAAAALSLATQKGASNTNTPVRVLSPGDNGSVSQSNSVDSDATAANRNATEQDADQDGGGATQAIDQVSKSEQDAGAASKAEQTDATNRNISVRVLSPGDDGDVSQSNRVDSDATALNGNVTKQDADQDQGGRGKECGCDSSGGIQAIGQESRNDQQAEAVSAAKQKGASNTNVSVRVLSPGDNGSVRQSNKVDSDATAANLNLTKQDADQNQGTGSGTQAIGQEAKNEQSATGLSKAAQSGASNSNTPVRVDSKGDGGHVSQSNSVESDAKAANLNLTSQDADQDQGGGRKECGCHQSDAIQAIGQSAKSEQTAVGLSAAIQLGASNSNTPVSVGGHGHDGCGCDEHGDSKKRDEKGHGGDVRQSNSVDSDATALNENATKQDADQDRDGGRKECGCSSGDGIQAIGQESKSEQGALAGSLAVQAAGHGRCGCASGGNSNTPVSVNGTGRGGDVDQSNRVDSDARAVNANATKQDADQDQGGDHSKGCGCHDSDDIQAIGQESKSRQAAVARSAALQSGASNRNTPVVVGGSHGGCGCDSHGDSKKRDSKKRDGKKGDVGRVHQSNKVDSDATAANLNATKQGADQDQGHGSGTQSIGQSAYNAQQGLAASLAAQFGARNTGRRSQP